jgi:CelD/BcsL family acetyltransferase involved in cellulose biosynthesis
MSPDGPFTHDVLDTPEAVLREHACWNGLVRDWYNGNPFFSMEHQQAWLSQVVRRGILVRYIRISAGGTPVGYFPLLQWPTFRRAPARCLEFPGVSHTGPILDGRFTGALLDYFRESVLPDLAWDVLLWERASPDRLPVENLIDAFRKAGHLVTDWPDLGNWIYEGEKSDFETYVSSLGFSTRYEVRRLAKRFRKTGNCEVRIFRSQEALNVVQDYHLVFSRSWKSADPNPEYIRELIRQFGALGQLRLAFLVLDGRPVATQLWLCDGTWAYAHTFAYDKEFKRCSPGTYLMTRVLQSVMEDDGVSRVDFLRGDESYKQHFMNRRQALHNFVVFPHTLRGRALQALDRQVVPLVRSSKVLSSIANFTVRRRP